MGIVRNYKRILGDNVLLWFLPVKRNLDGEGLFFEVREELM